MGIKKTTILIFLMAHAMMCAAQWQTGFQTATIGKRVGDFKCDSINLSSPLYYYLSRAWVITSGKNGLWADISTSIFSFDPNAPDKPVSEATHNYVVSEVIDSIICYQDTVAAIVTHSDGNELILLNYCWKENGKWVNRGQGLAENKEQVKEILTHQLPTILNDLKRLAEIQSLPRSVEPFSHFLSQIETSPEDYLMQMLSAHHLVINGEYHRRKVSWEMLKRLIAMPEFPNHVGCIFMELPSWCQPTMDTFLAADSLNVEHLLDIFREEQPLGWWDRGEMEFICDVWRLNKSLPYKKRIKIVLADYQIPYSHITSIKESIEQEDRNTHMADIIEQNLISSTDERNSLFLVGCAHAFKSRQPGIGSAAFNTAPAFTAAAQLANRLGSENVCTIFQHVLPSDNQGNNRYPIRGGIFDRAFEANGNRPVGFSLAGSPFGKEPFDGIYEIKYNAVTGTYADNFDGYLFLHSLADEPQERPLTELFTDEFVEELKRRAAAMGNGDNERIWFGIKAQDLTREHIIRTLNGKD